MESIDMEKHFISGKYVIREINCSMCRYQVGWRYVSELEDGYMYLDEALIETLLIDFIIRSSLDYT